MESYKGLPLPLAAEPEVMALAEQSSRYWPIGQWVVVNDPTVRGKDIFFTVEGYVTDFREDRRVRARVCLSDGRYRAFAMRFWGDRHPSDWSPNN